MEKKRNYFLDLINVTDCPCCPVYHIYCFKQERGRTYLTDNGNTLSLLSNDEITNHLYKDVYKICEENGVLFVDYEIRTKNFSSRFGEELDTLSSVIELVIKRIQEEFDKKEKTKSLQKGDDTDESKRNV